MNFAFLFVCVVWLPMIFAVKNGKNDFFSLDEISHTPVVNEQFQTVQLEAIKSYRKTRQTKTWRCTYQDHLKAQSYIPILTPSQGKFYTDAINAAINGNKGTLIAGASSIAETYWLDFDVVLVWKGTFVNTITYRDVLYGRNKTFHVGLGTPVPANFFHFENQKMSYYDLVSCIPFTDWIVMEYNHRVRDMMIVPKNMEIELRNKIRGIGALILEKPRKVITTLSPAHRSTKSALLDSFTTRKTTVFPDIQSTMSAVSHSRSTTTPITTVSPELKSTVSAVFHSPSTSAGITTSSPESQNSTLPQQGARIRSSSISSTEIY